MLKEVMHIGLTVTNLDRSVEFYKNILGLTYLGEIKMEGKETDTLFNRPNSTCRVAYLNGSDEIMAPAIELIEFTSQEIKKDEASLFKTSISEICFNVKDIDKVYHHLVSKGVCCLSSPQYFDFTASGFGKSKAIYFKDPDGIILELMESID